MSQDEAGAERQPILNMPGIVSTLVGLLLAIHAAQVLVLSEEAQLRLTVWFAYIPLRFMAPREVPGELLPLLWTPFTHALLHASWVHVLINSAWLAAFGSPVASRYGMRRFLAIFFISAAAGALLFTLLQMREVAILVGASGGISGLTGVAVRFIFQPMLFVRDPITGHPRPAGRRLATLEETLSNKRLRNFVLVWVGINALLPFLPGLAGGGDVDIAWQAHLGGFFAGFFLAPLFERRQA